VIREQRAQSSSRRWYAARRLAERTALCSLLLTRGAPGQLPARDVRPILDRASTAYLTLSTLSADFVQIVVNPLVGSPDTTRGTLHLMRPSRFAMRFSEPRGDRVVADGQFLWLYTPSTTPGQVVRSGIPETGTTGPNLIGQFVERPQERYDARVVRADSLESGWADVVALVPKATDLPYGEAVIWVNREDGLVRRIEIVETSGQRRIVILRRLRVNAGVAKREFTFSPPAGVRVVDL
jgi:outer membrane lipoprotein carrier protein